MAVLLKDGLISYWKLNEAAGANRIDSVGSTGNDLVEIGGSVIQGSPLWTGSIQSAEFTRALPYLQTSGGANGLNLGSGSFFMAAWTLLDSPLTVDFGLISKFQVTGDQRQFTLFYQNTVQNYSFSVSSDGIDSFAVDDTLVGVGTIFVCAWYDGDNNTVNIQTNNGTAVSAAGPTSVFGGTAELDIGRVDFGVDRVFDGEVDEVYFGNRVLNVEEKSALYNSGSGGLTFEEFKGSDSGFLHYYKEGHK